MANYNTNSAFSVSNAGSIPNTVDDLIFFEDINRDQKEVWDGFEALIAAGQYNDAQAYIQSYADVHGYFAGLYNMMKNRLYATQNMLILNKNNIDNGTGVFSSFIKPSLCLYQNSPDGAEANQGWIGPKDYFANSNVSTLNKLKIVVPNGASTDGLMFNVDADGYITINGTSTNNGVMFLLGSTEQSNARIRSCENWSYWNYYVSGSVPNPTSGMFRIGYGTTSGTTRMAQVNSNRTANMHGVLTDIKNDAVVELYLKYGFNETYDNFKVGFMICNMAETVPNQPYVPYAG